MVEENGVSRLSDPISTRKMLHNPGKLTSFAASSKPSSGFIVPQGPDKSVVEGQSNLPVFLRDFFLGGIAASISKTAVAPLERVKLLLQTQSANIKVISGRAVQYKGIADCLTRVCREEGFFALWRGNWANVVRYFPLQAMNFAFKDHFKRIFCTFDPKKSPYKYLLGSLLSGGVAGVVSYTFIHPLDFARTRIGADMGKSLREREYRGIVDFLAKTTRKEGLTGLYQGYNISVVGIFIYRALYFGLYDWGKALIDPERKMNLFLKFCFAQTVTATAGLITYPLDTIKRRLMMNSGRAQKLYKNSWDCSKKLYYNEGGLRPFFNGAFSNTVRGVGASVVLILYDEFQNLITKNKSGKA